MTIYRQSAYNGTAFTEPAPVTEGFDSLFLSGGTCYYQDDGVFGGSARFTGQSAMQHSRTFATTTLYWRGYFKLEATPTSNRMFIAWENASNLQLASLGVDTANKWRLRNQSGTTTATSVTTIVPGTWYGILYDFNPTSGTQQARIYDAGGALLETMSGGATAGTVARQREGVLQGNNTVQIWLDGTATADEVLTLTGGQIDPEEPGEGDPYRESAYEGTVDGPLGVEGGNGYYSAFDGVGLYKAPGFANTGTCARYSGQYALQTIQPFANKLYWSGWVRFQGWPDSNRIISVYWTSAMTIQAAIGIDTAGKWRLRALDGSTVGTSIRKITPGQWYGVHWFVDRNAGTQTLTIYSYFGSVLEVLSGPVATGAYDVHLEGCTQGRPTWWVEMDRTKLHSAPVVPSTALTQTPSNLAFKNGRDPSAPNLQPFWWNGSTLQPLGILESL